MIDWLDKHLVPGWREAWKRWSVRFGAMAGASIATMLAQPDILFTILNFLPVEPLHRAIAAAGIGISVWFAPSLLVLVKQKNLEGKPDDAAE
jgi:hypothetical protein